MLRVWYIDINVGKYTSPMDSMATLFGIYWTSSGLKKGFLLHLHFPA